ncbi:hypothetical protein SAICODRAFT_28105 [Saitoella complicata NRRL Y-17804]|uniref:Uncharacterized protein n=1 Tax=Saitoella complicata (strain BCRC 22490 / CBS 7301 / JCM 7358 / NBRC 10748 / NRRL Y-17804) TaxID=698492 RepID=A0A0E9NPU9_SAICN|nr:uncharacterized protein SAICODRAFT_28105 [Saitoella complicata NRRL Y-17804]ODQ49763.1 hypothetical protein SAICODRAFT_28105 [Saitoella complicata NRRL Y-17804]GAO51843.1 hypothetical protein G7K_5934-t1 [Saitoella complicata NRRL Y-17804]
MIFPFERPPNKVTALRLEKIWDLTLDIAIALGIKCICVFILTRLADGTVINYASRGCKALAEFTSDLASSDKGKRRAVGLARPPPGQLGSAHPPVPPRPPAKQRKISSHPFDARPVPTNFSQRVKQKHSEPDNDLAPVAGDKKRVLAVAAHRNNAKARLMEMESQTYPESSIFEDHFTHEDSPVPSSLRRSGSSALSSTSANAPPGWISCPPSDGVAPQGHYLD